MLHNPTFTSIGTVLIAFNAIGWACLLRIYFADLEDDRLATVAHQFKPGRTFWELLVQWPYTVLFYIVFIVLDDQPVAQAIGLILLMVSYTALLLIGLPYATVRQTIAAALSEMDKLVVVIASSIAADSNSLINLEGNQYLGYNSTVIPRYDSTGLDVALLLAVFLYVAGMIAMLRIDCARRGGGDKERFLAGVELQSGADGGDPKASAAVVVTENKHPSRKERAKKANSAARMKAIRASLEVSGDQVELAGV